MHAVSNYASCEVAGHRADGSVIDVHVISNTARRLLSSALAGNYTPFAGAKHNPSATCDRYRERRLLLRNSTRNYIRSRVTITTRSSLFITTHY